MGIQILFLVLFALNMLSIWLTVVLKKCEWYRVPGVLIFSIIPFTTVYFEQPRFELDFFWWRIAGIAAMVLGIGLVIWSGFNFNLQQELKTDGPYQYVRHSQYLGLVFMWIGWWWIWAAVYAFYFGMIILVLVWIEAYFEEKFILEKEFGDRYREYRHHAGMFWIK